MAYSFQISWGLERPSCQIAWVKRKQRREVIVTIIFDQAVSVLYIQCFFHGIVTMNENLFSLIYYIKVKVKAIISKMLEILSEMLH